MSLSSVRSYFRTRMNGLGHDEWKDGFNFDNIPQTLIDDSYHIESGPITGNSQNPTILDMSSDIVLRLFIKGYNDPAAGIDRAISLAETAICDIVNPDNANGQDIKTVDFNGMTLIPLDSSNDNIIIAEMNFSCRIFTNTEV